MMEIKTDNLIRVSKASIDKLMKLMHKIYQYKHFLSVRGFFSKCLDDLVEEIDKAAQEYIAQNSNKNALKTEVSFGDKQAISPAEQVRVVELLVSMNEERRKFLGHFLIWKDYRMETVKLLREIANEMQKEEEHVNRLNLVASLSGISAGIINVAKAVPEYVFVPEYVRKAATVLSAVNGIIRSYTSTTREMFLERLTKQAEKGIKDDKRQFQVMMYWFEYNEKLMDSVKSAIGSQLYELIFIKLKALYDENKSTQQNEEEWKKLLDVIVDFLIKEGYRVSLAVPLATVSLKLFAIFSSALLSLDWPSAALPVSRIAAFGKTVTYGVHAAISANDIINANSGTSRNSASCVGVILDVGPAVLDFSRFVKGDTTSDQAKSINKIAEALKEEINRIEYVYNSLNSEM